MKTFSIAVILLLLCAPIVYAKTVDFDFNTPIKGAPYISKYPINKRTVDSGSVWPYKSVITGAAKYDTITDTALIYYDIYDYSGNYRGTRSISVDVINDNPWTIKQKTNMIEWETFTVDAGTPENAMIYLYKYWYYQGEEICR